MILNWQLEITGNDEKQNWKEKEWKRLMIYLLVVSKVPL